jgi:flagellar protein FlaJ
MRIPFLLVPFKSMKKISRRFRGLGKILSKIQPNLGQTLSKIGADIDPGAYAVGSFISAFLYGLTFFILSIILLTFRGVEAVPVSLVIGTTFWLMFFFIHMVYPKIVMKKIAVKESKDLLFALREIMMDVNSGVPLFDAMKNVAEADYGYVTRDFEWVVKQIESGVPQRTALRSLALKTESEYLKRALWQIVNALETGSSMGNALPGIVQSLEENTYREIKNYSSNLNFLMLIYMLSAAVAPSLGITFLVLLSAFSSMGVTVESVAGLVASSALLQIVLIGYMTSTRPEIFGG